MAKKAYIGVGKSIVKRDLPSGYTQLDYIESTGTQYIDTGVYSAGQTKVHIDAMFPTEPSVHSGVFGADGGSTSQYSVYYRYNDNAYSMRYGADSNDNMVALNSSTLASIDMAGGVMSINDSSVVSVDGFYDFGSGRTIFVFAVNKSGTPTYLGNLRVFEMQIYSDYSDNETLVRDFVPAKNSSGEVGLFDMVTQTFYTDANKSGFVAGKVYDGSSSYNSVARKVKKAYIGIETEVPIYEETTVTGNFTTTITADNIGDFFEVYTDEMTTHGFVGNGGTFTSDNQGIDSSTAAMTWTAKKDMSSVTFDWSVSSESNYDMLTINHLEDNGSTSTLYVSDASGSDGGSVSAVMSKGGCFVFEYTKDSSAADGDDCATISNIKVTTYGTYIEKTQTGTELKGIAKKIKKAYIGIGGVARPCWSGGELAYYGTITPLSVTRYELAATTIGDYALFAGGSGGNTATDAYDKAFTRTIPDALSTSMYSLSATSIGNYALFGGGSTSSKNVNAYDRSLTRTTPSSLSYALRYTSAATVGNYALIGGGMSSGGDEESYVYPFDSSITRMDVTYLSEARYAGAATSVGDYAIFGGGIKSSTNSKAVDAFDKSLTRIDLDDLSIIKVRSGATTIGNYALFAGGYTAASGTYTDIVDVYDTSLVHTTTTSLSQGRSNLAATTVGNYAIFAGGQTDNGAGNDSNVVDVYDASLTRTIQTPLSVERYNHAATTINEYALFGGGYNTNDDLGDIDVIDVYTIA